MNIHGIIVDDIPIEEITLSALPDARLAPLSDTTKALIALRFGGDVDLAIEHAEYQAKTMHQPEQWVHELVKVHHGWKYDSHRRVAR